MQQISDGENSVKLYVQIFFIILLKAHISSTVIEEENEIA
jgi:hypothetical protein